MFVDGFPINFTYSRIVDSGRVERMNFTVT